MRLRRAAVSVGGFIRDAGRGYAEQRDAPAAAAANGGGDGDGGGSGDRLQSSLACLADRSQAFE